MKNQKYRWLPLVLSLTLLTGCSAVSDPAPPQSEPDAKIHNPQKSFSYQTDPENFSLFLLSSTDTIPVVTMGQSRKVTEFESGEAETAWKYPDEQIAVSIRPVKDYLSVSITSEAAGDNTFTWPNIAAERYYLPLGEGKNIPADHSGWNAYLSGQSFALPEQFSMPFWSFVSGDYAVLFIAENPVRTSLNFTADPELSFSATQEYPAIDENKTKSYRIYLTGNDPVSIAKIYKSYVEENGGFVTLEQKAASNPDIKKLYGAPFIYLWGDFVISPEDIDWQEFKAAAGSPLLSYLLSFAGSQPEGAEFKTVMEELKAQDYVAAYQKNVICSYISQLLRQDSFWNPDFFPAGTEQEKQLLSKGYENLNDTERIRLHKYALAAAAPQVFNNAEDWMAAGTTDLISDLKASGIDRAWIGLNSWEQAYAKPELVENAADQGYLIGSYDSYHSIHEPGNEQWITAKFEDGTLYDNATVTGKDGSKISGFQNVGRKLNPALSLPSVKARMEDITANQPAFNSWFIDCDATGEVYDDYSPEHITTQQEDLKARMDRMAYIRDHYGLVIGSEGGHDFAASTIAFAHGIELKSFSWMDEDMKQNKESEYYIGKYYHPGGGVAEHFSKRIPIKEQYDTIFTDPGFDVPLYKLVYNNSVITSYHWDWSTFKIKGLTKERMLREVLYNVPPLYHLDAEEWKKYKEDIISHTTVWSAFGRRAVTAEMTGFSYLTDDKTVQKTVYDNTLMAVANFGSTPFLYEEQEIPALSVLIADGRESFIYTPSVQPQNQ